MTCARALMPLVQVGISHLIRFLTDCDHEDHSDDDEDNDMHVSPSRCLSSCLIFLNFVRFFWDFSELKIKFSNLKLIL